jgi:hypothetical protein
MPGQDVGDTIPAETLAAGIGKEDSRGLALPFSQPVSQSSHNLFAQRNATRLAPLACAAHMGAGFQSHILTAQPNQLGNAQPGLQGQQQQGVVAPA